MQQQKPIAVTTPWQGPLDTQPLQDRLKSLEEEQTAPEEVCSVISEKEFRKLSKEQQKLHIAQDVREQIRLQRYRIEQEKYVEISFTKEGRYQINNRNETLDALDKGQVKCSVCARGAMFMSMLKFRKPQGVDRSIGNLNDTRFWYPHHGVNHVPNVGSDVLSGSFSLREQALIETTFENQHFGDRLIDEDDIKVCKRFHNHYKRQWRERKENGLEGKYRTGATYVLDQICQNILRNNGEYKPGELTDLTGKVI